MSDQPRVLDELGSARSVLVLADGLSRSRDVVCGSLLARAPPERLHAVAVTYNRSAREWLDHAREHVGGTPASVRLVDTGGTSDGDPVVVLESPDDLTGLEIAVTDPLPHADGTTVFCFDSLTALLQYVDVDRAYRFLHALVERLWAAGVRAHFHMDPAAHDPETVATFAALFDAVVATERDLALGAPDATVALDGAEVAVSRRPRFESEGKA